MKNKTKAIHNKNKLLEKAILLMQKKKLLLSPPS